MRNGFPVAVRPRVGIAAFAEELFGGEGGERALGSLVPGEGGVSRRDEPRPRGLRVWLRGERSLRGLDSCLRCGAAHGEPCCARLESNQIKCKCYQLPFFKESTDTFWQIAKTHATTLETVLNFCHK